MNDLEPTEDQLKKELPERSEQRAQIAVRPESSATFTLSMLNLEADPITVKKEIDAITERISQGDLSDAEQMLASQAVVLQEVFSKFITNAAHTKYVAHMEAYSKLALRAQNQCQRTLRTLLEYKNPKRATFIKQQNNTLNQQINLEEKKPEKEINPANELLEVQHGQRLDIGTQKEAVRSNPGLEAVGKINRSKVA